MPQLPSRIEKGSDQGGKYYVGCRNSKFYYSKRSLDDGISKRRAFHKAKRQKQAVHMQMRNRIVVLPEEERS